MKLALLATSFVALGLLTTAAGAGPVVHDSTNDFSSITAKQGLATSKTNPVVLAAVAGDRSDVDNMFDGDIFTAYSLGLRGTGNGATLELVIAPTTNFISSGSLIEWTNSPSGHAERALVSLGINGGSYVAIGEIFNTENGGPAGVVNNSNSFASLGIGTDPGRAHTQFVLTVNSGAFNTLKLEDKSVFSLGNNGTQNRDGFDVAELSITSAVPEPAGLALAGAALLVLRLARRRRS